MAVEEIEQFQPAASTQTHILIDSWYHCKGVRRAAQKRGWAVSRGLKSNRCMRRFEYEEDLLGSDNYQLMSRKAILRFWR